MLGSGPSGLTGTSSTPCGCWVIQIPLCCTPHRLWGHLAISGDVFSCHNSGYHKTREAGDYPTMWLSTHTHILQCTEQPSNKECEVKWKLLSHVWLFATPWTVACQAPLSMEFSRPEYWSGLPFPSPADLPNLRVEPRSPALQVNSLPSEPPGKSPTKNIQSLVSSVSQPGNPFQGLHLCLSLSHMHTQNHAKHIGTHMHTCLLSPMPS